MKVDKVFERFLLPSVVCITFLLNICYATPIETRPWTIPCEGDPQTALGIYDIRLQPDLTTSVQIVQNVSNRLLDLSNVLKQQNEDYESLDQSILPVSGLNSYFLLDGIPEPFLEDYDNVSIESMQANAKEDYLALSKVWVFIEQADFDAQIEDSVNMTQIIANYESIVGSLRETMCQLTKLFNNTQFDVTEHVTRDVMPESLRDVEGTTNKILRDLMIVKGFKRLADSLHRKYQTFVEKLT